MRWLLPAAVVLLAVLVELTLGRVEQAPDVAFFLGRFHPLVVHLPIGFFLLVAMGEAATLLPKLRERVEPALGLLLPVSVFAALAAFLMGQLLALEGGFPAQSLAWHRRLMLVAVMGMAACWVAFEWQRGKAERARWIYRGAVGATLGVLSLGAHFGGTMTRGEAYLAKYAPGPLKPLLGGAAPKQPPKAPPPAAPAVAEPLVYRHVVQPLLDQYCVECHGAEKQKGKLRLDSLEEVMKGGENGAVVVPGASGNSPLLQRTLLPMSDDDRMPPEDKPSPKPEELALLEFWIDRGATSTLRVKDALAPAASRALLEKAAGAFESKIPGAAAAPAAAPAPGATTTPEASASEAQAPPPVAEPAASPVAASPATANPVAAPATDSDSGSTSATVPVSGAAFLATYCQKCHGPEKPKGKLRVDSVAALLKGGASGAALVPGNPQQSSIVQRVRLPLSDDEHMPPKKEPQPTAAEIAAFIAWVRTTSTPAAPATDPVRATAPATDSAPVLDSPAEPAPAPDSASAPAAPSIPAASASTDSTASRPADPALLKSLPPRVALFADAVQPLLAEKCGKCHIRDKPAAGLSVAEHQQLLDGGYSGPGIVPEDRAKSLVLARALLPASDDEHMPPEGEPQLSADEIELIGAWIDRGAPAGGSTETAGLSAGAARALSALGVKAAPLALASQSGGCAACTVPGASASSWPSAHVLSLVVAASLLLVRRRRRAFAISPIRGRCVPWRKARLRGLRILRGAGRRRGPG